MHTHMLETKLHFCIVPIPQAKKKQSLEEFDLKHPAKKQKVSQPNNIAAVHIGEEDDEEKDDEDESFGADDQHDLDLESMTEQELRAVVKKRLIAGINDAEWLDRMDCGLVKLQVVPC